MIRTVAALVLGIAAITVAGADTYGRHERIRVQASLGIEIVGHLDPAAAVSLLRARDVKYFNRQGGMWVRFTIDNGSVLPGSRLTVERPVLQDQKLRQRDGSTEHRPLIELPLCVGRTRIDARLSLSDRNSYTAPLTLGKVEIAKLGAVDSAREYTIEPACTAVPADAVAGAGRMVVDERAPAAVTSTGRPQADSRFVCDGREHCSQMNSRAEAEFFVRNCPDTKRDGDHDGRPCENDSRW